MTNIADNIFITPREDTQNLTPGREKELTL